MFNSLKNMFGSFDREDDLNIKQSRFVRENEIKSYKVLENNKVNIYGELSMASEPPFQIAKVFGDTSLRLDTHQKFFDKCPEEVQGKFDILARGLKEIKNPPKYVINSRYITNLRRSVTSLPVNTEVRLDLTDSGLVSLSGIDKHVKSIGFLFMDAEYLQDGILSLLKIEQLDAVEFRRNRNLSDIVNEYIGKGREGILECQSSLILLGKEHLATF